MKTTAGNHGEVVKGRGSPINPEGRFEKWGRESADDGWFQEPGDGPNKPKTVVAIEHAKSVISRHDSPDVGFMQSINPYRGCEHACTYCISGDTLILMGNGRTLPMSEIKTGDEIYGSRFDGKYRRYTKARVLAHWSSIKPAYRISLEDGTGLIASGDHRFLTERGWKHVTGAEQGPEQRPFLTPNDKLMGTGGFAEGPGENDEYRRGYLCGMVRGDGHLKLGLATHEFQFLAASGRRHEMDAIRAQSLGRAGAIRRLVAWPTAATGDWFKGFLAGIFDAEGSFSQAALRISNTDAEIILWTRRCMDALGFAFALEHVPFTDRKRMDVVRLKGGLREHLRFFHTVRPAITRKLDLEGQAINSDAKLRVVGVEPLGKAMRLYDITTTTEDFIANGVVSHNCFARPSHAYLGLSPGIDFETRLSAKTNAAEKLREEFAKPGYRCEPLTIGVNTDAYQPIEREYRITRSILELCHELDHPISLITKSALIERDIDLLAPMSKKNLVSATLSVTTLENAISMKMEPRTSAPARRLKAIERLSAAGIPVNVNVAPVIPFLTDSELEPILEAAANAGAISAGYVLMRLPWEVKDIFRAWLEAHFPLKAAHVMSRVHQMRGGRDNDPNFGTRMVGQGLFADLLRQRFHKAVKRFGLDQRENMFDLDTSLFRPPSLHGQQKLF
ncbi:MAG TPA: PA0069 family radical SAM protein [Usitatibacter sp.]|nr:PA0069 family radical SAM protein [Usitatibacter sp.]